MASKEDYGGKCKDLNKFNLTVQVLENDYSGFL